MVKTYLKEKPSILQELNKQQEKAVTFGDGPLLIIAGAGTGKTTVLTRRIVWLIEQGLAKPEEILALTFTEKAAAEMEERVDMLIPLGYSEINISTFHAFAQKVLIEHALDIGLPGDFKVLDETKAWMLMQKNLLDFDLDYYRPMGNPTKHIHALLKHFDKAKQEGVTPEKYLEYAQKLRLSTDQTSKLKRKKKNQSDLEQPDETEIQRIQEIAAAFHKYQKMILDLGYLDYNDLINYTIELFRKRPKILKQYQNRFRYILVDEFQDTDLAQYELIKILGKPLNNITVVGDDDQSIYKFRGASISNILKFEQDYPNPAKISLTDNYRSGQKILDFAYEFIQQNNPERLEYKLKISKKLVSFKPENGEIGLLHADSVYAEAVRVVDKIRELVELGLNYNDFAILVRANDHADPFLSELTKRGVPYMYLANRGLYKKPFIIDLLAYFRSLDNYHENDSMFRVLTFKKFRMPIQDLVAITQFSKKKTLSVYEALKQVPVTVKVSEDAQKKIADLLRLLDKHAALARTLHAAELTMKILEDLGVMQELIQHSDERSEDIAHLRKFYSIIQDFESDNDDKSLKNFLNMIRLTQQSGNTGELAVDPNSGPEAVKVMTVHSSKGLEFRCVFIVNLVDARFPSRDRKEPIELPIELANEIFSEGDVHLMEERRLFYVAITRAKEYLFLTLADDYGGVQTKKPSRFLVETKQVVVDSKVRPTGEVLFQPKQALPLPIEHKFAVPESFSWSSISSFLKCPLEFKYKYLYQIPWPGNGYTSFGSSIHKTIQKFSQSVKQNAVSKQNDLFGGKIGETIAYPPIEKLFKLYEENWIDEWYETKADQNSAKQRGYRLLKNFYNKLAGDKLVPLEAEKFFKLKVGEYKFVGVMDCIYEHPDGSVSIVDYKTSQKARKKLERVDKKQLLIYQLAAQEFLNKQVKHLAYWDLEDLAGVIEFTGTNEEIEEVKKEFQADIEKIMQAIKNDSFLELDMRKSHECEFRHLEN